MVASTPCIWYGRSIPCMLVWQVYMYTGMVDLYPVYWYGPYELRPYFVNQYMVHITYYIVNQGYSAKQMLYQLGVSYIGGQPLDNCGGGG